ncbi:MAG TPA: alpha/beta fold hydrolase [Stellaceae bacterium]|jgi:pimeloyl-ACP methyl ester carboxylesterase|nr:alpha/beta fold hydrolase [Stellaceae bacterium]
MRWLVFLIVAALGLAAAAPAQSTAKLGIVLLHGKTGSPNEPGIATLAAALRDAGYVVELPEMCWSAGRIYDRPFLDCLAELDPLVTQLKAAGLGIVVAGHSLGGSAALAYGARHPGLAGIVALAPAPPIQFLAQRPDIAASLAQARSLVAQGQGDRSGDFTDFNTSGTGSGPFTVHATAKIYLSFLDPAGPSLMLANAARLNTPLLVVSGSSDPSQQSIPGTFAKVPANPLNRFVTESAGHMQTPQAAIPAVLAWLAALPAKAR